MNKKFFIGFQLSHLLKAEIGEQSADPLQRVSHQGKEYLGFYLQQKEPSLCQIQRAQRDLINQLQHLCTHTPVDSLTCLLFAQLFLG